MSQAQMTTGAVARLLETTEPKLGEAVRRGAVEPPPPVLSGRRLWSSFQILQAAEYLGLLTDSLRAKLGEEAGHE